MEAAELQTSDFAQQCRISSAQQRQRDIDSAAGSVSSRVYLIQHAVKHFWAHEISIVVQHKNARDHFGRFYLYTEAIVVLHLCRPWAFTKIRGLLAGRF